MPVQQVILCGFYTVEDMVEKKNIYIISDRSNTESLIKDEKADQITGCVSFGKMKDGCVVNNKDKHRPEDIHEEKW